MKRADFKPPRWWSYLVLAIVSMGVLAVGIGRVVEQPEVIVPASKTSETTTKTLEPFGSARFQAPSHGPLPPSMSVYTGHTSPRLQHPIQVPYTPATPTHTASPIVRETPTASPSASPSPEPSPGSASPPGATPPTVTDSPSASDTATPEATGSEVGT